MTQNHPKKGPRSPSVTNPPRKRGTAAETAIVRHALLRKAAA